MARDRLRCQQALAPEVYVLPIVLWTIACGTTEPPPPPVAVPAAEEERGGRDKKGKHGGAREGTEGTLVSVEAGDAACYLKIRDDAGAEVTYPGNPELCPGGAQDASLLVGKPVRAKVGKQEIAADSCQGNPECTDRQTVDFVQMMRGI